MGKEVWTRIEDVFPIEFSASSIATLVSWRVMDEYQVIQAKWPKFIP